MASYYKDSIAHDSILKETEFISKLRNPELDYTKSTLKNAWSGHTRLDYGEKPYLILRALKEDGGEWVMECVRLCNVRKALRNNGYLSEEFMKEIDVVVILHDSPLDIRYYGSRSEPIKGIRYKTNIHFYNITTGIFFDFNEMHATSLPASTLGDPSKMVPEEDVLAGVEIRMKKRHGMLEVE